MVPLLSKERTMDGWMIGERGRERKEESEERERKDKEMRSDETVP